MSIRGAVAVAAALLTGLTLPAAAQARGIQLDSAEAELRGVLRAFYFNLAHRDWEAIAADVLSAKVVASRHPPVGLETPIRDHAGAEHSRRPTGQQLACRRSSAVAVEEATIQLEGDWAGVSVPRCGLALAGADEFRLIHFEKRWRFVYIDLAEERLSSPLIRNPLFPP